MFWKYVGAGVVALGLAAIAKRLGLVRVDKTASLQTQWKQTRKEERGVERSVSIGSTDRKPSDVK